MSQSAILISKGLLIQMTYEATAEKQYKRKEKNRECSRMFRYKQRMKEDALKKGKIEKEIYMRRYFFLSATIL